MKSLGCWLAAVLLAGTAWAQSPNASSTTYLKLPLVFEANRGQAAQGVRYLARGAGYRFYLTSHEAILTLQGEASPLRLKLVGSNRDAAVEGLEPLPGKSHYLIGNHPENWITNVPQFASVQCRQVYPGIDLVFYGSQGKLEYDFKVAPGADPSQSELQFDGATKLELSGGDLVLKGTGAAVRLQEIQAEQSEILATFPELRNAKGHDVPTPFALTRRRRTMSPAAKARMSDGMRKYWAKRKAAEAKGKSAKT